MGTRCTHGGDEENLGRALRRTGEESDAVEVLGAQQPDRAGHEVPQERLVGHVQLRQPRGPQTQQHGRPTVHRQADSPTCDPMATQLAERRPPSGVRPTGPTPGSQIERSDHDAH